MQNSPAPQISQAARERWPGLDGLRGVAILLVFAFHLPLDVFRAGSYGVTVFFVLSGFLITNILLKELRIRETVELRWFYGRRAARLLPALLLVVLCHLILQLTVLGEPERWWERTWPVLAYVANLAAVGGADLVHMSHTWSLAIEEHFYILWPLILVAIKPKWRLASAWTLAVGFAGWRLALLLVGAENVRVFFSTDTNAFALFLGCALAITYLERPPREIGRNVSTISVGSVILASTIPWDFADRRLLYLAIPVAALAAVAIWALIATPNTWLEFPLLRWFGRISYGLYLWHFVLISMPWGRWPVPVILPMVVTPIAAAAISYYLLEAPVLSWWRTFELNRRKPASSAGRSFPLASPAGGLQPVTADSREAIRIE
jgi:peptidoglycan/LPS O-acetylase OafA/YrhL